MNAALITGAAGGIGQAICEAFKEAGYFVLATDQKPVPNHCDHAFQADLSNLLSDATSSADFFKWVRGSRGGHPLSVLVNCAAVQVVRPIPNLTVRDWSSTLHTNLVAPFYLVQQLLPELEQARGSVVNIASVHARATKPGFVCYATSKAAMVGLTQAMAVEIGSKVRVNTVLPAATATSMLLDGLDHNKESITQLGSMHPVGRIAEPREVAAAVVFLASDQATFINGAALTVDGGIGVRLHDPE